jgi:1-phosphofructokinase
VNIVTVTLNAAIDQTIEVSHLVRGKVNRAGKVRSDAGGKGVNVASCLADWGSHGVVTGILGRENAAIFEELFAKKHLDDRFLRMAGPTRTNIKVVDDGETTDINLPGLNVSEADLHAVMEAVKGATSEGGIAVLAGSLPEGCESAHYARYLAELPSRGLKVVLDASGPPLASALAGSVLPFAVKPNRHELAEWAGEPLEDEASLLAAARRLHERGVALVVVSRGAEGALFVSAEGVRSASFSLEPKFVATTVGAGDAMVAGIVAGLCEGADLSTIARISTAFAVAKLGTVGAHLPARAVVLDIASRIDVRSVA